MRMPDVLVAAMLAGASFGAAAAGNVDVHNPRPFGYVIGDVVAQRIVLLTPPDQELAPDALPKPGRVDLWLERRAPRVTTGRAGEARRHEIVIEYQIVNAPTDVTTIALPPLSLPLHGAQGVVDEAVAEWPVTVAPITPQYVLARAGLEEMRPDLPPPAIDTSAHVARVMLYGAALACIIGYFALRRFGLPWLPDSRPPFARACADLRRLARQPSGRDAYRAGLRRVHRAFDETAGHTVFAEQLWTFLERHPHFAPLASDAERFFADSRREFFGAGSDSHSLQWLTEFGRHCRRAELQAS